MNIEYTRFEYFQPIGGSRICGGKITQKYIGKKVSGGEKLISEEQSRIGVTETKLVRRSKEGIVNSDFFFKDYRKISIVNASTIKCIFQCMDLKCCSLMNFDMHILCNLYTY